MISLTHTQTRRHISITLFKFKNNSSRIFVNEIVDEEKVLSFCEK